MDLLMLTKYPVIIRKDGIINAEMAIFAFGYMSPKFTICTSITRHMFGINLMSFAKLVFFLKFHCCIIKKTLPKELGLFSAFFQLRTFVCKHPFVDA